jgi:hypothetical protein
MKFARLAFEAVLTQDGVAWIVPCVSARCRLSGLQVREHSSRVKIIGIPYSEHSSWTELRGAVAGFRPLKLVPTVNATCASEVGRKPVNQVMK